MKETTKDFYRAAVRATIGRIAGGLDEALDLAGLAGAAGVSALHFHRIFRGMLGETPLEVHRRLRLERAAHRLATSDEAVTAIAFDAGFETHESFTRAFQGAYRGLTPSQFRKRMGQHRAQMGHPERFPFELRAANGVHFDPAGRAPQMVAATGGEDMDVVVEELGALRLAAVTHLGPRNMVGEAFGRLAKVAGPAGLFAKPGAYGVAVFHDDPETTPAAELRTSAGLIVPDGSPIPEGLTELVIAAGRYARTTHHGHYAGLSDSWLRLMGQWLPASGHRVADRPSFEIYRVADHSRPESDLGTDLYVAIAE